MVQDLVPVESFDLTLPPLQFLILDLRMHGMGVCNEILIVNVYMLPISIVYIYIHYKNYICRVSLMRLNAHTNMW